MPDIIVNTSPIQYLYQSDLLYLLQFIYGTIIIPDAVFHELNEGLKQGISLPNISSLSWIDISEINKLHPLSFSIDLGRGESEVLSLAMERKDSTIIIDDALARRYARFLNLPYTGTIGVLLKAKKLGYIPFIKPIIQKLNELRFHLSEETTHSILKLAGEL